MDAKDIYIIVHFNRHMSKKIDIYAVLEIFFKDPDGKHCVRDCARILKISPSTASAHLNQLFKQNILQRGEFKKAKLYQANLDSKIYRFRKRQYNIEQIVESGLLKYIEERLMYPRVVILFGSMNKGENRSDSDIDLFIISEHRVQLNLKRFEKKLGEIQIFLHTTKEFQKLRNSNGNLIDNVINGTVLSGMLELRWMCKKEK